MSLKLTIGDDEALLSAIDFSDNNIVFLIGSPLSCTYGDTIGIPGVKGMLDIIETKLAEKPKTLNTYHQKIKSDLADTEKYQSSFEFLSLYTSPNTVNGIIRKATLEAYNADTSNININDVSKLHELQNDSQSWSIPPATKALAEILLGFDKASKIVLTPNFDPLLSIALSQLGHSPSCTVLHGDSNIEQFKSSNINIVHFHGFWNDTDTLHTPAQLTLNRPLLQQSLMRLLNEKTLVVIGYGGWDDVFTQVLFSLISDSGANFDILWSFYESNEESIKNKYSNLIKSVTPAIQRGRFKIYGGINCHEFLPLLKNEHCQESVNNEPLVIKEKKTEVSFPITIQSFKDNETALSPWFLPLEKAYNYVRCTERSYLIRQFETISCINIESEWGINHKEFIFSLTTDKDSLYFEAPIYKINLSGVTNKKEFLKKIETETGITLQVFIQKLPTSKHIIFFDDIAEGLTKTSEITSFFNEINQLTSIITEYNKHSKIILLSRKLLSDKLHSMKLFKFEDYDAKSFIKNNSSLNGTIDNNAIDTIIDLAKGIPSSLERYINDLDIYSSEELYEEHYIPESYYCYDNNDDFPIEIINRVEALASSQELHTQRSYQLLETLAILEHGDTFYNIRDTNPDTRYRKTNLDELYNLELVESVGLTRNIVEISSFSGETKLLKLPAAVRRYVFSKLSLNKVYEISKNIAKVHLGKSWKTGNVKLCKLTIQQIKENDKVAGSTQVLLAQLLKCSIELDISNDIKAAIRACRSYCKQISNGARYKEVISFSKHIRAIAKESNKIDSLAYFNMLEGYALRMLSMFKDAEPLLLNALSDKEHLDKYDITQVLINLMFMYDSQKKTEKAIEYAKEALKIDPKNSDALLKIEELSESNDINKLKKLEVKFRNNNKIVTANNAAITLCDLEISHQNKLYWLNRILASQDKDQYNQMRAITKKALLKSDIPYAPTKQELKLLHACYIFSFSQGMSHMFNDAHDLLWTYYSSIENYSTIFNLYWHSSLYWRIYGNVKKEIQYSNSMAIFIRKLLPEAIDQSKYENAYVIHRVGQLATE